MASKSLESHADAAISAAPIRLVPVALIKVDDEIQRQLDRPRVNTMAQDFDMNALGVVTVSDRGDKEGIYVVDGQHRVAAMVLAGGEEQSIQARVFTGLTRAEEAVLYRRLNTTKKPQALDLFRSRLIEEDPTALAVQDIYTRHGWKLGFSGATGGRLSAVAAMERIYRLEPLALDRAIYSLTKAWGRTRESSDGRIVEGLGLFFWRHGDTVEIDTLIQRLAALGGGASGLVGKAHSIKDLTNKPIGRAMASYLTDLYNKGKSTRALQPFDNK